MPIGTSDGQTFESELDLVLERPLNLEKMTNSYHRQEIKSSDSSQEMPLNALAEASGELNSIKGTSDRSVMDKLTGADGGERYQTWPERHVRKSVENLSTLWEGFKAVYEGRIDPQSDEGQTIGAGIASALAGMGYASATTRQGAGTFGGVLGASSNKFRDLKEATSKKLSEEDVWKETGWFYDRVDRKWKFEISDVNSSLNWDKLKEGKTYSLSEVFEHKELYDLYPELKNISIKYDPDAEHVKTATAAFFEPTLKSNARIVLGKNFVNYDGDGGKRGVILHEIQHWIQNKEDFSKGSSVEDWRNLIPPVTFVENTPVLKEDILQGLDSARELTKIHLNGLINGVNFSKEQLKEIYVSYQILELEKQLQDKLSAKAFKQYFNDPGEIEARNVQTRLQMDTDSKANLNQMYEEILKLKEYRPHPKETEKPVKF